MGLINLVSAQKGVLTSQTGSPTTKVAWISQKSPKITPQIACSALSGDPTGVTSTNNHSIFSKWSQVKLLGSRGESYITKWLPDHKSGLNWRKKTSKIISKICITFLSIREHDRCYIGNQPLGNFNKRFWLKLLGIKRAFLHHKLAPRPQKRPELAKNTLTWLNNTENHPQKMHVPLCHETRQVLHRQSTALILLNGLR